MRRRTLSRILGRALPLVSTVSASDEGPHQNFLGNGPVAQVAPSPLLSGSRVCGCVSCSTVPEFPRTRRQFCRSKVVRNARPPEGEASETPSDPRGLEATLRCAHSTCFSHPMRPSNSLRSLWPGRLTPLVDACLLTPVLRSQFFRSISSTPTSSSSGCASS